jgi:DNA-binding PadR family transcriptional regulator
MKTFNPDLIRSSTEMMVLAALTEDPKYGYQILQTLRSESAGAMGLSAGTLYPILHRLEVAGAVRSFWREGSTRRRKYYSLTAKGKRRLRDKADQWQRFSAVVNRLLQPALESL